MRTPHLVQGRCWKHGGLSPVKHGRYSKLKHERLGDLIEKLDEDPDPLNILPELAIARALFVDFVQRYEQHSEALLAWYDSYVGRPVTPELVSALRQVVDAHARCEGPKARTSDDRAAEELARECVERLGNDPANRPRQILDLSDAYRMVSEVTRIWERIQRARNEHALARDRLIQLVERMGESVAKHVSDPLAVDRIRQEWYALRTSGG
jgi:hypothetical protein